MRLVNIQTGASFGPVFCTPTMSRSSATARCTVTSRSVSGLRSVKWVTPSASSHM
jgi:hypothetical protein